MSRLFGFLLPLAPTHRTRAMSGLASRIASALAVPWQTSYVAPACMAISGVAYALRGYEVRWSEPSFEGTRELGERDSSTLTYTVFTDDEGERVRSHGVELSCVLPVAAVDAELRVRRAVNVLRWQLRGPNA